MEDQIISSFLGTGWGFPPAFSDQTHSLKLVSAEEDIQQSLFILMSTTPGERIMNPAYGCDLHKLVFSPISSATYTEIAAMVSRAILLYEPRVKLLDVEVHMVSIEPGILHIVVDYIIIQTNSRSNLVYPFYWQEGTNIL